MPPVAVTAPARSKLPTRLARGPSARIRRTATASSASPMTTGAKKTQRQPTLVSAPPAAVPSVKPAAPTAPYTARARVRSGPSGKLVVTMLNPAGVRKAAATPVANRAATRIQPAVATPPRTEKPMKTTSAPRKTRRLPTRSETLPPRSMNPA